MVCGDYSPVLRCFIVFDLADVGQDPSSPVMAMRDCDEAIPVGEARGVNDKVTGISAAAKNAASQ